LDPGGHLHVLFGAMRDKDVTTMARLLADAGAVVTPVPLEGERAMPEAELGALLARFNASTTPARSVPEGLAHFLGTASPSDALLITGSHLVVAQLPASAFPAFTTNLP